MTPAEAGGGRRVRRRTAVLLGLGFLLLSLSVAAFLLLRPERIRRMVTEVVQGFLRAGYEAQVDDVELVLGEGMVRVRGFRILRGGEVLASAPLVEVETRLAELHKGRVTGLRVRDPEVLLVRGADGKWPLLEAFRPSEGPAGSRPSVRVEGGMVRFRDEAAEGAILAPGAEVRLRIESVDLRESRRGGASSLEAVLVEEGPAGAGKAGALGRIALLGEVPAGKRGLKVLVERFVVDGTLLDRLSPGVRAHLEAFEVLEGPVGEGPLAPGLEVTLASPAPGEPVAAALRLRPRGLRVVLRRVPIRFTEVRGEVSFAGGELTVEHVALRRAERGEIHVKGSARDLAGDPTWRAEFWARDIDFDRELHDALPEEARSVWDAYDLGGIVDFTDAPRGTEGSYDGYLERREPGGPVAVLAMARLVDGSLSFKGYPDEQGVRRGFDFPVTGATGRLEFRMPVQDGAYQITLSDLKGFHEASPARAQGTILQWPEAGGRAPAIVDVTVECDEVPLDEDVREGNDTMRGHFATWSPRGIARRITVHVVQDRDLDSTARTQISMILDGRAGLTWRELPLAVDRIEGLVEVREDLVNGVPVPVTTVRGMKGVADGAAVSGEGTIEGTGDPRVRANADFKGLRVEGAIREAAAKAGIRELLDLYRDAEPRGLVDLHAEISGTASKRRDAYRVDLRGLSVTGGAGVKWDLEGLEGTVEIQPEQIGFRGLRGRGPEGPVNLSGTLTDPAGAGSLDLLVTAASAPLDGTLRARIPEAGERLEEYFRTVGPRPGLAGDATVRLRGTADALDPEVLVENLRGGVEPLGLRGLVLSAGSARFAGTTVTVEGIEGAFEDRSFGIRTGRLDLEAGSGTLDLRVRRLRFPRDLVPIIPEETAVSLERLAPDRWFHSEGLALALSDRFRTLRLDGVVGLSPPREGATGGLGLEGVFDLRGVTFAKGPADDDPTALSGSIGVTGGRLTAGVTVTDLEGTVELSGILGPRGNTVLARLSGATARVEGRQLVRAGAEITFPRDGVLVKELRGILAGGALEATVQSGAGRPAYEGRVSLANAAARSLFVPADATSGMEGKVTVDFRFRNMTGKAADLVGEGRLVLVDGKLFKVPVFEAIYSVLGRSESPEFESMRLLFDLKGDRLRFDEIFLDSSVLALHKASGGSHAWLDGRLDVDLRPELKGILELPILKIPVSAISRIMRPFYERALTVHVGGTLQNPEAGFRGLPTLFSSGPSELPRLLPPPPATSVEPSAPIEF